MAPQTRSRRMEPKCGRRDYEIVCECKGGFWDECIGMNWRSRGGCGPVWGGWGDWGREEGGLKERAPLRLMKVNGAVACIFIVLLYYLFSALPAMSVYSSALRVCRIMVLCGSSPKRDLLTSEISCWRPSLRGARPMARRTPSEVRMNLFITLTLRRLSGRRLLGARAGSRVL